jgi:hypothetical protein
MQIKLVPHAIRTCCRQVRLKGSKCVRSIVIETAISRLIGMASEAEKQAFHERERESKATKEEMAAKEQAAREERERLEVAYLDCLPITDHHIFLRKLFFFKDLFHDMCGMFEWYDTYSKADVFLLGAFQIQK